MNYDDFGNSLVGCFVNEDMLVNVNVIPRQDVLQANISKRLGLNPAAPQLLIVASYDDEVNKL